MKKSPKYNFHIKLIILVIVSPYAILFAEIPAFKKPVSNLLDVRFKGLEKEKEVLLQSMRPFSSISFKYTSEWSRDQRKTWNKGHTIGEFHWDRSNGNYRYNKVMQLENKGQGPMLQIGETTCWNKKTVGFGYNYPGSIEMLKLPELGKIPLDGNSSVIVGRPNEYLIYPGFIFPNLQYVFFGMRKPLIDLLNDPEHVIRIRKITNEKEVLLRIAISYDKAYPERDDVILEFDLEKGVFLKSMVNIYHKSREDLAHWSVIEFEEFVDIKGWKIPMHVIHSREDVNGKRLELSRFMIDRETFKLNEPIPIQTFMPRIAQPVTIFDETLGITYKNSSIPGVTEELMTFELDALFEQGAILNLQKK